MAPKLKLSSSSFEPGGRLARQHTCDGEGISPPLRFHDVPEGTACFALVVDDPDAPRGTFTHWLVWNIPADTDLLQAGELPDGAVQGKNSGGAVGWYAACPPNDHPPHRYFFRLYALDAPLELGPGASREQVTDALRGHVLANTEVEARYAREGVVGGNPVTAAGGPVAPGDQPSSPSTSEA